MAKMPINRQNKLFAWLAKNYYLLAVLIYLPALTNFFSADDWFHLRITQVDALKQFFNFFSFTQNPQTASFYRPLSTQVFFFIFQSFFGLTAWPYYLFGLVLFGYTLYLVKKLSGSSLAVLIYGISVSNFTRLYFISAFQELFMVVFSLLTLINFKKKPGLSLLFFILALLSKETAIILPVLILLLNHKSIKASPNSLLFAFYILLSLSYLYFRLFHFGLADGVSYVWNFSLTKAANTLMWYILWSFGAPELLVDYVGSGFKLIPRFFIDYQYWWTFIVFPLVIIITSLVFIFFKNVKKVGSRFWVFSAFFLVSILPFLFLPSHKFTLELGLPLVGFAIAFSVLLKSVKPHLFLFTFTIFLIYNLSMNYLTYTRHYSVSRSKISHNVYIFFKQNYPKPPSYEYFEFINDTNDNGEIWGQSKQISQSLSGSDFFKVFYHQPRYIVYYQDITGQRPSPLAFTKIQLSTKQFLNQ